MHGLQPPQIAAAIIETALKPIVVGEDPFDVDVLWERMYNRTRPFGQKGAVPNAISAVDIAIWDCMGRALGKPVHKLLGGAYRTEVQPYATGFYRRKGGVYPEEAIAEARGHVAKGFKAMKLKIGFGLEDDIAYIRSVRDAIGPGPKIMIDANHAYTVGAARRLLKAIEPAQPDTRAVCIKCTAIKRPGSFNTTVCTRYQGSPIDIFSKLFFAFLLSHIQTFYDQKSGMVHYLKVYHKRP